mmetsp:Transcript_62563/g.85993  ORF Transcript_62563/g.85993 Transcript_62563/m.85993 type:complete len:219 (-) Transcript_62563:345-1001(-)
MTRTPVTRRRTSGLRHTVSTPRFLDARSLTSPTATTKTLSLSLKFCTMSTRISTSFPAFAPPIISIPGGTRWWSRVTFLRMSRASRKSCRCGSDLLHMRIKVSRVPAAPAAQNEAQQTGERRVDVSRTCMAFDTCDSMRAFIRIFSASLVLFPSRSSGLLLALSAAAAIFSLTRWIRRLFADLCRACTPRNLACTTTAAWPSRLPRNQAMNCSLPNAR